MRPHRDRWETEASLGRDDYHPQVPSITPMTPDWIRHLAHTPPVGRQLARQSMFAVYRSGVRKSGRSPDAGTTRRQDAHLDGKRRRCIRYPPTVLLSARSS